MANLGIDTSKIESMLSQLRAVGARASAPGSPTGVGGIGAIGGMGGLAGAAGVQGTQAVGPVAESGFAGALKASLDQVNASQKSAQALGESFAAGDDKVNLSDVMISMQKANINFQATVQVRNRLVSAYHDIMSMQI